MSHSFGEAIELAKRGHKIARSGWDGKNMFVTLMPGLELPPAEYIGDGCGLACTPHFAMYKAQDQVQLYWTATQADMLANDWMIA